MKPLVSIITVSYNTRKETVQSIESVYKSKGFKPGEIEILIVDNNSPDDSVAYIKNHFPKVQVIANKKNRGFGGGNNQAAKIAKGKYLLLLNPDAFLGVNSLRVMVDRMEADDQIVSVGPQLRYADNRVQLSGGYLPTPLRVTAWMLWLDKLPLVKLLFPNPYHVISTDWHTSEQSPEWLMGACILFRKDEFLVAGGFDEEIFMYAEEVELYRRLKESLGKRVLFTPETEVVHLGGVSTKKANAYRLALELKGVEYIYRKHYPNLFWLIKLVIFVGVILRLAVFSLIPSRRDTVKEYLGYFRAQ
jgi:N-acetylglucosaminyl-diphospho-decaprenol L-rhamnosyltransferase